MKDIKTIGTGVIYPESCKQITPKRPTKIVTKCNPTKEINIIALIPVFNKSEYLNFTLNSLIGFADAVIILDDGSTDATSEIAFNHPLTIEILTKPSKPLNEWNDSENRYELYQRALNYNPDWIICLDADEILDPRFSVYKNELLTINNNIKAFAFYVVDIDNGKCTRERFGHRMYRCDEGYQFDKKRLHCRLLPLEITPMETLLSNLVIYHDASEEARINRYEKYKQADPDLEYQSSYEHLKSPLIMNDIPFRFSNHEFSKVIEDGLQRRFFKNYTQKIIDSKNSKERNEIYIIENLEFLQPFWKKFNTLNLNAFHIVENGIEYECICAFDSSNRIKINHEELLLIEEIFNENNFPSFVSNLLLYTNEYNINTLSVKINKLFDSLKTKGIIKNN